MSRKREIICIIAMAIVMFLSLAYQKEKLNERYNQTLTKYSQEVIELKNQIKEKDEVIAQKEAEIESRQMDYSGEEEYINYKFRPDGRIYSINAANIAFYPVPELTGRISEAFEFVSDVSDPLEREDGITVYSYLTTKGVVYSDMRVSLYAR